MTDKDYKEYIKQFGQVVTNQKTCIQNYLEELCSKDAAIKEVYKAEKMDECYQFIVNCAKNMRSGGGNHVVLDSELVFKMARDYFLEILPKQKSEKQKNPEDENEPVADITESKGASEVCEQMEKDIKEEISGEKTEPCDNQETEGGEDEILEMADRGISEICAAMNRKDEEPVKYDKDGNGLLFGF